MLNRSRKIKSLPLIAVLFTCVVILSSAAIFASEDGTPSSEVTSWLAPDLDSVQAKQLAEEVYPKLSEATRAVHDVNDIYLLLYDDIRPALMGSYRNSNFSLPRIAYDIRDIYAALIDGNSSNIPVGPGIRQMLYGIDSQGNWETLFDSSQDTRDFAQLIYASSQQIHADGQNNTYYLSQINSKISGNFNWLTFSSTFQGAKYTYGGDWLQSGSTGTDFYLSFNVPAQYSLFPNVLRVNLPIYAPSNINAGIPPISLVDVYTDGNLSHAWEYDYFIEPSPAGTYLYFFNFNQRGTNLVFHVTSYDSLIYVPSLTGYMNYIPFDTDDYQQLKQAFYQAKAANAQGSMASDVKRLADYLADPDKIAAEQASQQVIDSTLDDFTGSGSAAAGVSDTTAMKNISGSVKSGLDTGGSAGDAASVFTNANFWSWFTQSTSDGINNPYPAPTVEQRRGSGDYIPDFISGDHEELENYRNRRDRW